MKFPIIPCDLCGSQDGLQRAMMKKLLDDWEEKAPGRRATMWRALQNVRPGHLARRLTIFCEFFPEEEQRLTLARNNRTRPQFLNG
ncbi:MAG: hypothetical protein R3C42_02460 [Parvularculaceae bacterium]